MMPFAYIRAVNAEQAVEAMTSNNGARFVAGGTNLLDFMRESVESAALLIDLNAVPLRAIEHGPQALRIGALARMSDVAEDPLVREEFPMVAIALEQSASPQLRNMASIGGNLLQRTRCQYFRDVATPCNKRHPGAGCGALQGANRKEAVLGTSEHCIASHASDLAVTLAALNAVVHVEGSDGARDIAFRDFYRLPGETPHLETALRRTEIITAVSLPRLPFARNSTYVKVRDRAQYEFALVSAAVALDLESGRIRQARVALGGVGTIPWRSLEAEGILANAPANGESFRAAAGAALAQARGHGENDFKIPLAKRALIRALEIVAR